MEFRKTMYNVSPKYVFITLSDLDKLVQKMQNNQYLRDLYQKYLSIYFEYVYDLGINKSIHKLLISDFFEHLLPRYYSEIQSSISIIANSRTRSVANFKKFLDLSCKVATNIQTFEGAAFVDALDFSSPVFFEKLVADELERQGFRTIREHSVGDSGLDFIIRVDGKKIGIEVKSYKNSIIPAQVIESLGKLRGNLDGLVLVSSASFSDAALQAAKRLNINILTINQVSQIRRLLKSRNRISHLRPQNLENHTKEFNQLFKDTLKRTKNAVTNNGKKKSLEDLAEILVEQIDGLK